MRLTARYLVFGAATSVLAVLAFGGDAGLVPAPWANAGNGALVLLATGAPALACLAPHAGTRLERALTGVLVTVSGLAVGVLFDAVNARAAVSVIDLVARSVAVLVVLLVLQRLRDGDALATGASFARAGFLVASGVTALAPVTWRAVGAAGFLATLALVIAHLRAADDARRVPGAVAAGVSANPFVPAVTLVGLGLAAERFGGYRVEWAAVHAEIVLGALVVSALAPGVILAWRERRAAA